MNTIATSLQLVDWINSSTNPQVSTFFDDSSKCVIARAPGRLDLMGGIADYSGSLVLQWPIQEATWAVVQKAPTHSIDIISVRLDDSTLPQTAHIDFDEIRMSDHLPISYTDARRVLTSDAKTQWAAYVAGVLVVLMRERAVNFQDGLRILIASNVPEGKGVSSSAAIEVATMCAVCEAFNIAIDQRELGILCQKVENEVVGAPCGVMDQMASACGQAGSLMALRCRPAELLGNVALPLGVAIWGIDSGVRHSVSGADYGTVRTAAFMGLKIIETISGSSLEGYLTELTPSEAQAYINDLPINMTGKEFQRQFGDVADPQSHVMTDRDYPIRASTLHPVNEHHRVNLFRELLSMPATPHRLSLLGELMYQAHNSYNACGLGTPQTDRLVTVVREAGPKSGLYGAKITGGGSGGTVAILGEIGSDIAINRIAESYQNETGLTPYIFTGTSEGAWQFGVHQL